MEPSEEFRRLVLEHFRSLTPALDRRLGEIARGVPEDVQWLLFEYDSPHFADEFALVAFQMTNGVSFGEPIELLGDDEVVVPSEIYDAEKFGRLNPWSAASKLVEQWFIERWSKTTVKPGIPTFIAHHDSYFLTNLDTGVQTNIDEILAAQSRSS